MDATWIGLGPLLVGGVLLYGGGEVLVRSAAQLGLRLGMSPLVVGLTVVAFGTSSPELAVSVDAALDDKGDVAVGNVIGSNICNVLGILGTAALVQPLAAPGILASDLWTMLGVSLLLLPLAWTGRHIVRREGALLLALYAGYVAVRAS